MIAGTKLVEMDSAVEGLRRVNDFLNEQLREKERVIAEKNAQLRQAAQIIDENAARYRRRLEILEGKLARAQRPVTESFERNSQRVVFESGPPVRSAETIHSRTDSMSEETAAAWLGVTWI
jgi:hypothetical protein